MNEISLISDGYKTIFGSSEVNIVSLPASGSDRKYYRITDKSRTIIGVYNQNPDENQAFVGFTKHFISKKLPVPEIFGYLPEKHVYFLQDLGNTNLFTWLLQKPAGSVFDRETISVYKRVLEILLLFQTEGIKDLDLELCYPHRSFDKQSMMWDMNYFKYMFLKLISVPFNERKLEHDFNVLSDFLLKAGQDYFLYRDFQSANIMILNGAPWFIDYQGGRRGAPQYDMASLLYDAKAHIPRDICEQLLDYYTDIFCNLTKENRDQFLGYYTGFSLIRLMQALGAFGFRGLYEKKPTFTESIIPAVKLMTGVINSGKLPLKIPELQHIISIIHNTELFKILNERTSNNPVNNSL
jgi:aminoglycoside/choline kinase family phosphotransferase